MGGINEGIVREKRCFSSRNRFGAQEKGSFDTRKLLSNRRLKSMVYPENISRHNKIIKFMSEKHTPSYYFLNVLKIGRINLDFLVQVKCKAEVNQLTLYRLDKLYKTLQTG